jgi:hypothetical protein
MSARKNETHDEYLARRRQQRRQPERLAQARKHARLHRLRNPDKVRHRNKLYYSQNPGARGKLKRTYGITPAIYDRMCAQQNGLCASCGGAPRHGRPLCVDHCHKTKIVRGLICDACNVCAGHIESHRFQMVMAYLARQERSGWDCWGNETDKFRRAEAAE